MKKKKIVLDIVGKAIAKYGFNYDEEGSEDGIWMFIRKKGDIEQRIWLLKHRFESGLILRFDTSAYGVDMKDASCIIPPNTYGNVLGTWTYLNEDGFHNVLKAFVEIIEKYGIDTLNKMSIEEKWLPTKEMFERLFDCCEQLSSEFIKKHKLHVKERDKKEILIWFDLIEGIMDRIKEQAYEKAQKELVEIAAFLGEQLKIGLDGKWERFGERNVQVDSLNCYIITSYSILLRVVEVWKNQNIRILKEEYLWIFDAKLPLSRERMIELQEKLNKIRE